MDEEYDNDYAENYFDNGEGDDNDDLGGGGAGDDGGGTCTFLHHSDVENEYWLISLHRLRLRLDPLECGLSVPIALTIIFAQ